MYYFLYNIHYSWSCSKKIAPGLETSLRGPDLSKDSAGSLEVDTTFNDGQNQCVNIEQIHLVSSMKII